MAENCIGVVGLGQMGLGIAQVAAQAGFSVAAFDANKEVLKNAQSKIKASNIKFLDNLENLKNSNLIIEAIIEDEKAKKELFTKLDNLLDNTCIFASNTSSISITSLASVTRRPERFIGMHFMNPVPRMPLVEVIRGHHTSDETENIIQVIALKMDKVIVNSKDRPGFIVNRILMPMINEAFYALMEQVGSAKDIDTAMKLGCNFPMGPLTLADFIGLDVCLAILEVLHKGLGQDKYAPCPLLRNYVNAQKFGKKTGEGVFSYGL